eukprot:1198829-Prymnesium_polylepis.1
MRGGGGGVGESRVGSRASMQTGLGGASGPPWWPVKRNAYARRAPHGRAPVRCAPWVSCVPLHSPALSPETSDENQSPAS